MMENVERTLLSMAIKVIETYNGKYVFISYKEALERYNGAVSIAKVIGFTDEKIAEIEEEAKKEFYGK